MADMLYKVIAFVTLLHGLTPKLGVWVMNVRGRQALLPPSALHNLTFIFIFHFQHKEN